MSGPAGVDPLTCPRYPRCTHVAADVKALSEHYESAHPEPLSPDEPMDPVVQPADLSSMAEGVPPRCLASGWVKRDDAEGLPHDAVVQCVRARHTSSTECVGSIVWMVNDRPTILVVRWFTVTTDENGYATGGYR